MHATIYYFSGTGNSMHIAKQLQEKIYASRIIPIVQRLRDADFTTESDTIGIIFPIYYLTLPKPVKDFIQNIDIDSAEYIFAVATRCGAPHAAFAEIDKILKKKGRTLDAWFSITMGDNDPKYNNYKSPTKERLQIYEAVFSKTIERIKDRVESREKCREEDKDVTEPIHPVLVKMVPFLHSVFKPVGEAVGFKSHFYADSRCTSCGVCEKVCLSGKIKITDKKPQWRHEIKCFYCYACLNYCPRESVQIKGFTEKKRQVFSPLCNSR